MPLLCVLFFCTSLFLPYDQQAQEKTPANRLFRSIVSCTLGIRDQVVFSIFFTSNRFFVYDLERDICKNTNEKKHIKIFASCQGLMLFNFIICPIYNNFNIIILFGSVNLQSLVIFQFFNCFFGWMAIFVIPIRDYGCFWR